MKKKFILIISVTIFIFICAVCCIRMNSGYDKQYLVLTDERTAEREYSFYNYETVNAILYGAEKIDFTDTEREYMDADTNTTGTAMVIYTHDIIDYYKDGWNGIKISAYFTSFGSKPMLISDDIKVKGYILDISDNGKAVVFCEDDTLYLYENGRKKEIYHSENIATTVISPDGKTVAFAVAESKDNPEEKYKCFLYQDDKIIEVNDNFRPISVSDGGKVIYGYTTHIIDGLLNDYSDFIVIENLTDVTNLGSGWFSDYYFSTDRTQFLFANVKDRDMTYYLYDPEIGEKIKVIDERIILCDSYYEETNLTNPELVNFDDFAVYDSGKLLRFTRNGDTYDISEYYHGSSESTPALYHRRLLTYKTSSLGQYELYLDYGNEKVQICSDMFFLCGADKNCETVYYVNTENELMCFKDGKTTVIDTNILFDTAEVTQDGVCVYIKDFDHNGSKGSLCFSEKGKTGQFIRECCGAVINITVYGDSVAVETKDSILVSNDGKNFRNI